MAFDLTASRDVPPATLGSMWISIPDFLRGAVTIRLTAGLQAAERSQPDEREENGDERKKDGSVTLVKPSVSPDAESTCLLHVSH